MDKLLEEHTVCIFGVEVWRERHQLGYKEAGNEGDGHSDP
jgi:hypothetical protein